MSQRRFTTIREFTGYRNKKDETNFDSDGFLVNGSQNVVSTDGDTVAIRQGYTAYGAAASGTEPIEGSYEWKTHRGEEIALRSYDDELEFYDSNSSDWVRLADSFTAVDFQFAEYWDTTESQDILLLVNGTSNIYYWSGGLTTFASATVNTITKQGTTSWAEEGFLTAGTRSVIIEGTTYAYTGGESTTTLTGVTPDPTAAGHTVGIVVHQALRTAANSTITSLPNTLENDLIAVQDNHVWIGSESSRIIYVSKVNDYTDFSFLTPRLVGDGVLRTLDQTPTAFVSQEDAMYLSAGTDFWYQSVLTLSADNTSESLTVSRLKTSPQQGALQQSAVGTIKNYIVFISNEPTLDFLGRVENVDTTQSRPISDPIKSDFDDYDFTGAHIKYFKNNLYITVPVESKLLIFNLEKGFWEAPWILPAGRLAIIGGDLYLHSNAVDETYKLFEGNSDLNVASSEKLAISAIAAFNYMHLGEKALRKVHDEWFSEGYISSNTTLDLDLLYDYTGYTASVNKEISGDETQNIIFSNILEIALGDSPLGDNELAGPGDGGKNKFRVIHEMPPIHYYEIQPRYSSNGIDQNWEVLAFGGNISIANDDNNDIKL